MQVGKKANQRRLASRISALLDTSVNDGDGLLNIICVKCKHEVETIENSMIDLNDGLHTLQEGSHQLYFFTRWPRFAHGQLVLRLLCGFHVCIYIYIYIYIYVCASALIMCAIITSRTIIVAM